MEEKDKTKGHLIAELAALRRRVDELESSEASRLAPEQRALEQKQDVEALPEEPAFAPGTGNDVLKLGIEDLPRSERPLYEDREVLEGIFSGIHYLVAYLDRDFNFIRVNEAYAKAGGKSPSFFVGKNHFDLYPHDENQGIFRRVIETGEPYHAFAKAFEYLDRPELGKTFWDWSLVPVKQVDGKVGRVLLTLIDVTERKRSEEEIKDYITRLERSNRALDEFAYVASHDLQEPLRKIKTFGDRLRTKFADSLTPDGLDDLERMINASIRMRNLINALLTYSRVATRAKDFVPVNMAEIAREALYNIEALIERSGGTVHVEDLPSIEADRLQMLQLIQNLLSNALKFHREGAAPRVKIGARIIAGQKKCPGGAFSPEGWCEIRVEDNGIGFDEKYIDRIFSTFQRLQGRSEYEGVGMGLAICQKIVERHRGSITAKSKPGLGSTFIVTLPVKQPQVIGHR